MLTVVISIGDRNLDHCLNVYRDLKEAKQQMGRLEHQTLHVHHHPTLHNSEISIYKYKGPHSTYRKLKRVKSPKIITQFIQIILTEIIIIFLTSQTSQLVAFKVELGKITESQYLKRKRHKVNQIQLKKKKKQNEEKKEKKNVNPKRGKLKTANFK